MGDLVDEFRVIVVSVRDLPAGETTRQIARVIATAAEDEDLALRRLRDTFGRSEDDSGARPSAARDVAGESLDDALHGDPALVVLTVFVPRDENLFEAFDEELVRSNGLRRRAVEDLAVVTEDTSQEVHGDVAEFASRYSLLVQEWDGFHSAYDDWRRTEGGCDRSVATAALGEFVLRFGALADRVRGLPRATFLQPMGELFIEAAESEAESLRSLRSTWRPFDSEVYRRLDQDRDAARRLRRQVAGGLQELLDLYDSSLQALETESSTGQ